MLPVRAPFDSRAEAPQPLGLVGRAPLPRPGDGTEFAAIRPFHTGDRLRRINWRVSLRTGDAARASAPAARRTPPSCVVVDALADHGVSGGVDGAASSLDVTVRAAAAIAEHHVRRGDRVALRVVGSGGETRRLRRRAPPPARASSAGWRRCRSAPRATCAADQLQLGATAGTVVIVLSPMLSRGDGRADRDAGAARPAGAWSSTRCPTDVTPLVAEGTDPRVADLAWRMRRIERDRGAARGWPRSAARWWPGAGRAPSTRSCAGWRAGPSCRRCGPDDPRVDARASGRCG